MFGFLNRNKNQSIESKKTDADQPQIVVNLDDAKKNLYDSVVLRRTDIVVSLMNEWFKGNKITQYLSSSHLESIYNHLKSPYSFIFTGVKKPSAFDCTSFGSIFGHQIF